MNHAEVVAYCLATSAELRDELGELVDASCAAVVAKLPERLGP